MNKIEAMKSLAEAKQKIAECEAIINAQDKPLSPVCLAKEDELYYYINYLGGSNGATAFSGRVDGHHGATFSTLEAAKDYTNAFQVMLELRACEGVVHLSSNIKNERQVVCIKLDYIFITDTFKLVTPDHYTSLAWNHCNVCPLFDTLDNARLAIAKVGEERIIKAMKTMAWLD